MAIYFLITVTMSYKFVSPLLVIFLSSTVQCVLKQRELLLADPNLHPDVLTDPELGLARKAAPVIGIRCSVPAEAVQWKDARSL